MMIEQRLAAIKKRIDIAAGKSGRSPEDIRTVCVIKEAAISDIVRVIRCGFFEIGENRVQEAERKKELLRKELAPEVFLRLRWHMLGHLQTNKVNKALQLFKLVQSVDNLKLANVLSRQLDKSGSDIDILLEVNISREASKFGVKPEQALDFTREIIKLPHLNLRGLMGIGAYTVQAEQNRRAFKNLSDIFKKANAFLSQMGLSTMPILSMGMSGDFEVAIEEGANMVRIGRAIFEGGG
ncbi:MAG: YggS family pyridoxal phosphate-dependent enzyme [Candidatus Omnitrophota bacterium]